MRLPKPWATFCHALRRPSRPQPDVLGLDSGQTRRADATDARQKTRPLAAVLETGNAFVLRAIHAAEDAVALLHAVTDHFAAAVVASRRQGVNGALERIKRHRSTRARHGERLVVF